MQPVLHDREERAGVDPGHVGGALRLPAEMPAAAVLVVGWRQHLQDRTDEPKGDQGDGRQRGGAAPTGPPAIATPNAGASSIPIGLAHAATAAAPPASLTSAGRQGSAGGHDREDGQGVVAADGAVLVERQVPEQRGTAGPQRQRRAERDERGRADGEQPVQGLHRGRSEPGVGEREQEEVPGERVSLVPGVDPQIGEAGAVAGEQPCLELVPPHLVSRQEDRQHERIRADQEQRDPPLSLGAPGLAQVSSSLGRSDCSGRGTSARRARSRRRPTSRL